MMGQREEKTWLEDPSLLGRVVEQAESSHASRIAEDKSYLRYYWDRPVLGRSVDYTRPYREIAVFDHLREQRGNNLTAEVVDAAVSILCRDMAAKVTPKGADFELDQGCKQATRLIEGVFDNSEFGDVASECARDGMTSSFGPCKGYIDKESGEIRFMRLDPLNTYWVNDGTPNPRTMFTNTPVARDEVIARYPKFKDQLRDVAQWQPQFVAGVDPQGTQLDNGDTIKITEGWCGAIGEEKGRHVISCGDIVLFDEEWEHEATPVFSFVWSPDFRGYAGRSLTRIISKYDSANRRLTRMLYAGLAGAVPQLLRHVDCETKGLTDMEYGEVEWDGTIPPQIIIPQSVSPDLLAKLKDNREMAFAEGGVNQGLATGNAPARYTSGAAQRQYVDIANTRLLRAQKQWEKFWRAAARVVVMLAQQARKTSVKVSGANYYDSVTWPKLPRDKFKVSFGMASGLSLTPAERLQDLIDLKDLGVIDVPEVARGLQLPDTEAIADRLNAPRDLIMRQISMALDNGIFSMPSKLQDLNSLVKIGGEEYQRARLQGNYPPANVECLRRLILAATARLAPPAAPAVQQTTAPGIPVANDQGAGIPAAAPVPIPQPAQAVA